MATSLKKAIYRPKKVEGIVREKFIQEQKENYRDIKKKLGIDIDLNRIEDKLDKIRINIVRDKIKPRIVAFYNFFENDINFKKKEDIDSNSISSKRTRLHETNHYMAGRRYGYINIFNKGLLEGMNENLVTDYFDDGTSSFYNFQSTSDAPHSKQYEMARVQYNFMKGTSYPHFVSLVKQLEYVTGVKSYESSINGNTKFLRAIISKLGIANTIKLCAVTNRMNKLQNWEMPMLEQLEMLQDMIMHISFDKEFEEIQSIQDAQSYLERLREFEKYRGKITYLSRNGDLTVNNTYREYYTSKFAKLQDRFKAQSNLLEEYRYKEQDLKPTLDEREDIVQQTIRRELMNSLLYRYGGDNRKIARQLDVEMLKRGASWVIYKINGEVLDSPIINIGDRNNYLFKSIGWKKRDLKTTTRDFMRNIGAKRTGMTIEYTDGEIDEECEKYKEDKEKSKEELERMLIKEQRLTYKIRRKLFNIRRKRLYRISAGTEAKAEKTERPKKKPSWDLSNWEQESNANVQVKSIEDRPKKEEDLDIE